MTDGMGGTIAEANASLALPIKPETTKDAAARAAARDEARRHTMVPYVTVGDLDVEVDWTIKNLDTNAGPGARSSSNGANEWFATTRR